MTNEAINSRLSSTTLSNLLHFQLISKRLQSKVSDHQVIICLLKGITNKANEKRAENNKRGDRNE
jgi:hypothetical protein